MLVKIYTIPPIAANVKFGLTIKDDIMVKNIAISHHNKLIIKAAPEIFSKKFINVILDPMLEKIDDNILAIGNIEDIAKDIKNMIP